MKKLLSLVSFLLLFSCAKEKTADEKKSEKKFEMYELSEMAMVMEQMYVENQRLKDLILANDSIGQYPDFFEKINSAKTTEPGQFDDFFKEQAVLFLETQKDIYKQKDEVSQKKSFNKMVDACIQCHEVKCQGPIDRIQKLYIN
jgi:cytochrome c553